MGRAQPHSPTVRIWQGDATIHARMRVMQSCFNKTTPYQLQRSIFLKHSSLAYSALHHSAPASYKIIVPQLSQALGNIHTTDRSHNMGASTPCGRSTAMICKTKAQATQAAKESHIAFSRPEAWLVARAGLSKRLNRRYYGYLAGYKMSGDHMLDTANLSYLQGKLAPAEVIFGLQRAIALRAFQMTYYQRPGKTLTRFDIQHSVFYRLLKQILEILLNAYQKANKKVCCALT
ncbi:hypothetical protein LTR17_020941 [Elasticomyces elasticus]|nr:hypothetical protein LTR17_020941 [Elasticomyces elasticus]